MKILKYTLLLVFAMSLVSCSSVKVMSDYDSKVDFSDYKTFAFYKKGIDKASVSDLDKRRILRAIESNLMAKGFVKSENPDMLISIFTKSREKIDINNNMNNYGWGMGFGWGWNPWMWGGANQLNVNQYTEGTLFIDVINKKKNELIWQGIGSGAISGKTPEKKKERIEEFVARILEKYPPNKKK